MLMLSEAKRMSSSYKAKVSNGIRKYRRTCTCDDTCRALHVHVREGCNNLDRRIVYILGLNRPARTCDCDCLTVRALADVEPLPVLGELCACGDAAVTGCCVGDVSSSIVVSAGLSPPASSPSSTSCQIATR